MWEGPGSISTENLNVFLQRSSSLSIVLSSPNGLINDGFFRPSNSENLEDFAPFLVEGYEDLNLTQARVRLSLTLASSSHLESKEQQPPPLEDKKDEQHPQQEEDDEQQEIPEEPHNEQESQQQQHEDNNETTVVEDTDYNYIQL